MSKIAEQLSDCNEILIKQIQEKTDTSANISLISSSMRKTAKSHKPKDRSVTVNKSEK